MFRDEQNQKPLWVWIVIAIVVIPAWWGFIQQIVLNRPFGTNPGPDWSIWLTFILGGIVLPIFFYIMKLVITVEDTGVRVQFVPFVNRVIPYSEVQSVEAKTYRPIAEYGGWGIRGWGHGKRAYSMRGTEGAELTLTGGQIVMLGSDNAQALANAIRQKIG